MAGIPEDPAARWAGRRGEGPAGGGALYHIPAPLPRAVPRLEPGSARPLPVAGRIRRRAGAVVLPAGYTRRHEAPAGHRARVDGGPFRRLPPGDSPEVLLIGRATV